MNVSDPRSSPALAWLRLVRLPNLFTAIADVSMGYFLTHESLSPLGALVLLVCASCSLYAAGAVLNDVFDFEEDRRQRPDRPLPSGQIEVSLARQVGVALLLLGVGIGVAVTLFAGDWRPAGTAIGLAALVVGYNAVLKRTPLGPVAMGGCRALNVLLGMSTMRLPWSGPCYIVAASIGLYIVGVTWYSRAEAVESSQEQLAGAMLTMLVGAALVWVLPQLSPGGVPIALKPYSWIVLLLVLGLIGGVCSRGIVWPDAASVQASVTALILMVIVLDAAIVLVVRSRILALAMLLLLAPAMLAGRWIRST